MKRSPFANRLASKTPHPPIDIPANLIEFPRQLVAPRKARPRLAEGPLREEADETPEAAQLRIFEVEANQISTAPAVESVAPEWSSILLAAHPVSAVVEVLKLPFNLCFLPRPHLSVFALWRRWSMAASSWLRSLCSRLSLPSLLANFQLVTLPVVL